MSFDLYGCYYINPKYPTKKLKPYLEVIGANHSDYNLYLIPWITADEQAPFLEQVSRVVKRCEEFSTDQKLIKEFLEKAKKFEDQAKLKGYRIVSDWV